MPELEWLGPRVQETLHNSIRDRPTVEPLQKRILKLLSDLVTKGWGHRQPLTTQDDFVEHFGAYFGPLVFQVCFTDSSTETASAFARSCNQITVETTGWCSPEADIRLA